MRKKNVIVLGSTGSIGINTLDVLSMHFNDFNVYALSANSSIDHLFVQCKKFKPKYVHVNHEIYVKKLKSLIKKDNIKTKVLFGNEELNKLVSNIEIDIVVCAISGSAGLESTLSAVKAGKKILLANKESLVMCGNLFMDLARKHNAIVLPVDSEHNALHQCFSGNDRKFIKKVILTASGGPFLNSNISNFDIITVDEALNHPTWNMGKKISVDSATMMNKGLEVIEAMYLFNLKLNQIDVVIHPQSIIHSMVCYSDGSIIAQASINDMKVPISYCLGWPKRIKSGVKFLNLTKQSSLTFIEVSKERYPCFYLAKQVAAEGGSLLTAMNAANEIAVQAFIDKKIKFTDIYKIIFETLEKHAIIKLSSFDDVILADKISKKDATTLIKKYNL